MTSPGATDLLERAAVSASALCLAHCLALPLLFSIVPALSAAVAIPASIHLWLLAAAVPMASAALIRGRVVHGRAGRSSPGSPA